MEEECNFKREFKGTLREPFVLAFNDLLLCESNTFPITVSSILMGISHLFLW